MYLDSLAFKAMESGLKQLNIKQQIHTQNIANIDTPDYKYKYVTFENTLDEKIDGGRNIISGRRFRRLRKRKYL